MNTPIIDKVVEQLKPSPRNCSGGCWNSHAPLLSQPRMGSLAGNSYVLPARFLSTMCS